MAPSVNVDAMVPSNPILSGEGLSGEFLPKESLIPTTWDSEPRHQRNQRAVSIPRSVTRRPGRADEPRP